MRHGHDSDKAERDNLPQHCYVRSASQSEEDREVEGGDISVAFPQFEIGVCSVDIKLRPNAIIVYGSAPNTIFEKYRAMGITILQFDSDYKNAHKKAVIA